MVLQQRSRDDCYLVATFLWLGHEPPLPTLPRLRPAKGRPQGPPLRDGVPGGLRFAKTTGLSSANPPYL